MRRRIPPPDHAAHRGNHTVPAALRSAPATGLHSPARATPRRRRPARIGLPGTPPSRSDRAPRCPRPPPPSPAGSRGAERCQTQPPSPSRFRPPQSAAPLRCAVQASGFSLASALERSPASKKWMHAQTRARQRLPWVAFACGGAFSFAGNAHHRPLGQNVQTLAISCQRLSSLLRLYYNTSHCAILHFACCVFLQAWGALKTAAQRDMERRCLHRCAAIWSKKSAETCARSRTRRRAARAPEPVTDRAPGTRKRPARDGACHARLGRHNVGEDQCQTPADPKTRRGVRVSDPVPDCADRRSGCGRSEPRSRGCRVSRDGRLHQRRRGRHSKAMSACSSARSMDCSSVMV